MIVRRDCNSITHFTRLSWMRFRVRRENQLSICGPNCSPRGGTIKEAYVPELRFIKLNNF